MILVADLDGTGSLTTLGFDPRTVQPVASRYTDYTVPTACVYSCMSVCRTDKDSGVRRGTIPN